MEDLQSGNIIVCPICEMENLQLDNIISTLWNERFAIT